MFLDRLYVTIARLRGPTGLWELSYPFKRPQRFMGAADPEAVRISDWRMLSLGGG